MTIFNRYTIILSTLLLLNPTQLLATTSTDQLKAEQERLKSKTQAINEQIQSERLRIEQLKRKIEQIRVQNQELDQHLLKKIKHYKSKVEAASNGAK